MIGIGIGVPFNQSLFGTAGTSYLLDTYTAAAAYSLRQLKTGVTNVVRVRRSSDSAESDFTADEITDGTLTTWTGANDGYIVKLYNQGTDGASYDMEQATAANQPRLVSSGVVDTKNGLPAMYFDGSNDNLQSATAMGSYNTYPFTFCAVGSNEVSNVVGVAVSIREGVAPSEGWFTSFDRRVNKIHTLLDEGTPQNEFNYPGTDNSNSQRLQTFNVDSSGNGEAWKNGTSIETIASMAECVPTASTNLYFGGQPLVGAQLTGYIQEFVLWNTDEGANISAINTEINTYYSIY